MAAENATRERSEWAQNLFPRDEPNSSNIRKFLTNKAYNNIETEKRGPNLKIAHKTATHPVFEKLFNDVVPDPFRNMAADKSRFNDFIDAWGRPLGFMTDSEKIEDNKYNTSSVQLPIIVLDKFPKAKVKSAAINGDCSIHTIFTCLFPNFRKLTQEGKDLFVAISKTNILPWMLFKNKGTHRDPEVKSGYPIEYNKSWSWDIHQSIKDIRVPTKFLSDEDINAIIRLFNAHAFIWNPEYTYQGRESMASLAELGTPAPEAVFFFALAPEHYMPICNGASWYFSTESLMCIANYIAASEASSSCKYKNGDKVVYGDELYYVVDRLAGDSIKTGTGLKSGKEAEDVITFVRKGLERFSKDKEIKGEYTTKQKNELKKMCIKKALGTVLPQCIGYILLKNIDEGEQWTKTTDGMIKAARNYEYTIRKGKDAHDPYSDGGKSLPEKIDRYNVQLVVVKNEDEITSAEGSEAAVVAAACMNEPCTEYYAEVIRLLDTYGKDSGVAVAAASSSNTENDEAKTAAAIAAAMRARPARRTARRESAAASAPVSAPVAAPVAAAASAAVSAVSAPVPAAVSAPVPAAVPAAASYGRRRRALEAEQAAIRLAHESSNAKGGSRKKTVNRKKNNKNRKTRKQY